MPDRSRLIRRLSRRPRLWLDITLALILKFSLLYAAYLLWFAHPLAHHMRVDPQRVDAQFLGLPNRPAAPASPSPEPQP